MKINLLRIAVFLFLISFKSNLSSLLACVFIFLQIKKWTKYEIILSLLLLFRLFIPCLSSTDGNELIGKVIQINENSILIENHGHRWQIITQQSFILDDQILVKGNVLQENDLLSFFNADYKKIAKEKRILATVLPDSIQILKSSQSFRGRLHRKIKEKEGIQEELLLKILFNQKTGQFSELLTYFGIQYNLLYSCMFKILCLFFYQKHAKRICLSIFVVFTYFFHFPMAMIRKIVFELLSGFMSLSNLVGFYTILVYLFHPPLLGSLSFLFPIGLILVSKHSQLSRMLYTGLLQSYYFHKVSLVSLFGYSFVRKIMAILYLLAIIDTVMGTCFVQYLFNLIDISFDNLISYSWNGKIPFILFSTILIMIFMRIRRGQLRLATAGFLLIQSLGLWHPYAEVSFINVGQGDAILIRLPLNQGNILIDTGKYSSFNSLDSFLTSKGIKKIHALILTHYDEDHAGNLSNIQSKYQVDKLIQESENEIHLSDFTIKVLSPQKDYGNDNDNSLVLAFSLNDVRFLLLGDISETVEYDLIQRWGPLNFDVVKIAHHGSRNSTSMNFLRNFDFKYAIISSGFNYYGHPHKEVIERLNIFNKTVLNTQTSGDITFVFTALGNFIVSSAHEFDIIN